MSDKSNFTYLRPSPESHPRTISIHGNIPTNADPSYDAFNEFLWILAELERNDPGVPITLVIDSQGGSSSSLDMLLDYIKLMSSPVYMVARNVSSAASILFASGEKDHRYIFEHSRISLHNGRLLYECPGHGRWIFKSYCDTEERAAASQKVLDQTIRRHARMLDEYTDGKLLESEETDEEKRVEGMMLLLDESPIFDSQEAVQYGLADHIIDEEKLRDLFFR